MHGNRTSQHCELSVKSFSKEWYCVSKLEGGEGEAWLKFDQVRSHSVLLCQCERQVELISCEQRNGNKKDLCRVWS